MLYISGKTQLNSTICYGDKSITHRALIFASIATGSSVITNACICNDTLSTANCLVALGAKIKQDGSTFYVTPIATPNTNVTLDCGNSGTSARLLAGLVCGLGVKATFVGDESLSRRPMTRLTNLLEKMGARFSFPTGCLFQTQGGLLVGKQFDIAVASAQIKSALLIAGLFADGTTVVNQPTCRDHTEIMLAQMGASISVDGNTISVSKSKLNAMDVQVPNDFSTAAFLIAVGLKHGCVLPNVGVNPTRIGALEVLRSAGARIDLVNQRLVCGEPVADVVVHPSRLLPMCVTKQMVPSCIDEIPILVALALTASGTSSFYGLDELRVKECDRLAAVMLLAQSFGQKATVWDDDGANLMVVSNGNPVAKGVAATFGDHRLAMSALCLATYSNGATLDNHRCVDVSCPQFLRLLGVNPIKLGLVGADVGESLSPRLQTLFASSVGVDLSYEAFSVDDKQVFEAINYLDGANVTAPYKQLVAQRYGVASVNTIANGKAHSTDGYGVVEALLNAGIDINGKNLLVLGAGGAAYSAVESLLLAGARLNVVNRTESKAQALHNHFGINYTLSTVDGVLSFLPPCKMEEDFEIPLAAKFVFTAEYKSTSPLVQKAKERNLVVVDGLSMLFYQGKRSFTLWTGVEPQVTLQQFVEEIQ